MFKYLITGLMMFSGVSATIFTTDSNTVGINTETINLCSCLVSNNNTACVSNCYTFPMSECFQQKDLCNGDYIDRYGRIDLDEHTGMVIFSDHQIDETCKSPAISVLTINCDPAGDNTECTQILSNTGISALCNFKPDDHHSDSFSLTTLDIVVMVVLSVVLVGCLLAFAITSVVVFIKLYNRPKNNIEYD